MVGRWWHFILGLFQFNRPRGLMLEDMEKMDVGVDEGLSRYDLESLRLEEGQVVGTTVLVEDAKLILTEGPTPDPSKSE